MNYKNLIFGERVICFGSLKDKQAINISSPFTVLLPASNKMECLEAHNLIVMLLDMGCIEFCCVGTEAEFLHDNIDNIIEDRGKFEVVTTYHLDEIEACEYFLFAAGGGIKFLLALVSDHPNLINRLQNIVESMS